MTTIVVADDHKIVRQGVVKLLEEREDFTVVGEASDGEEAVQMVLEKQPDVVIMDIWMPRLGGIDARPEFSTLSWFSMLFAAGMGIGLMFWSVAEPTAYYTNWYGTPLNAPSKTPQGANAAMGATMFHWGLHPWAIYAVVGLSLAFFTYNKGLPLTIRLFDVAASKRPSWLPLPPVDAGVLGRQGVRLYADEPVHGIYRAQLQAIAVLAPEFEIRILLPYVADLKELQYWRNDIKRQLACPVTVGAMAETPAAALQLREWLEVVEFVAIGCNDLMQCLFGADRDQPELQRYLDPYAPALYRFLRQVADTVQDRLDAVQLCGVLPQLPGILPLLMGLGYRAFSVEATMLPYLWKTIAGTHSGEARMLAERACRAQSSAAVRELLGKHAGSPRT